MLLYHGETLFDRANDDSQYFAKTVLGFMVSCMFGGHTFCFKNTTHCEIEFTISSWTKKTYKGYHQSVIGWNKRSYLRWQ